MSRTTRAFRRNATSHHGSSVEFAELLDAVVTATVLVAEPAVPEAVVPVAVEPAVVEPAVVEPAAIELVTEPVEEPLFVSRFADAGLDDDRLPIRSTARHSRRR